MSNKTDDAVVDAALSYAGLGWKIVPLQGVERPDVCTCQRGDDCPSVGKHPSVKSWQTEATDDQEKIQRWADRGLIRNLGVKLGPDSGIIDIECDSPEAEQALAELFGDDLPIIPTFTSGRGKHRIFKWSDQLPPEARAKAVIKFRDIEIRTGGGSKGAQSVFPPSKYHRGGSYKWLPGLSPEDCDPAEIPPRVLGVLAASEAEDCFDFDFSAGGPGYKEPEGKKRRSREHWEYITSGVSEGGRNNAAASMIGQLLRNTGTVHDKGGLRPIWGLVKAWNATNSPPLPMDELRTIWTSILEAERARRHREEIDSASVNPLPGKDDQEYLGDGVPPGWKIIRIESDPPEWELYSPLFGEGRFVKLDENSLTNRASMKRAISRQLNRIPPASWFTEVFGNPKARDNDHVKKNGLLDYLLREDHRREAPAEATRINVVAELVWDRLQAAELRDDILDDRRITLDESGSYYFRWKVLLSDLGHESPPVTPKELTDLLSKVGATERQKRFGDTVCRFKVLNRNSAAEIQELALSIRVSPNEDARSAHLGDGDTPQGDPPF